MVVVVVVAIVVELRLPPLTSPQGAASDSHIYGGAGTHCALGTSHMYPGVLQLVLSAQVLKQAGMAALHEKGVQSVSVPVAQVPLPSQKRADKRSAPEHIAAAHITDPF